MKKKQYKSKMALKENLQVEQKTAADKDTHRNLRSRLHPDHSFDPSESTNHQQAFEKKLTELNFVYRIG